ncbi:hypothetical protein [uncultured Gammaproteobacteria bacterium]|nr:hypothetical protein [uncultured Gammaproteobacteria bacterium]CAC9639648.1 hypothetical protein [uncultured Gammaproteobacteria bacterium]CAC9964222.1 hypothetical protein [uncultured Gammaproteobacteria bacterium]
MRKLLLITLTAFALSVQVDLAAADHAHNGKNSPSGKVSGVELSAACKSAISAASAENRKAKKVGFEWRDTKKFIKQAKKAGGKKCVKLANKAKAQALNAQQQAKDQANAGPVGF